MADKIDPPRLCYTIWFTQRNGSTLLSRALTEIGTVGTPGEWLNNLQDHSLFTHYQVQKDEMLLPTLWKQGMGQNGIYGQKVSMRSADMKGWITEFRRALDLSVDANDSEIWAQAFPHSRHIFLTRRNKVRQAVSWWKAIQTQEWHRKSGHAPQKVHKSLIEKYNFEAIRHLLIETTLREAAIESFFADAGVHPLTIVYEDFVRSYEKTIRQILAFIGKDHTTISIPVPSLAPLADEISEQWVQRFRTDIQTDWEHLAW